METEQIKILTQVIAVILVGVGSIFFLMMLSEIIEFMSYVSMLRANPARYGYELFILGDIDAITWGLFIDKAVFWGPLFIMGIIILKIGKKT